MTMGNKIFWICFAVYTLILIGFGIWFLGYTDKCLNRYEASQSEHAMDTYFDNFETSVKLGIIPAEIEIEEVSGPFEEETLVSNLYLEQLRSGELSYAKAPGSYATEAPIYRIYAGEIPVADVHLSAYNEETIFAILTIMDWKIESVDAIFNVDTDSYTVNVPDSYRVTVNGVELTEEYLTGETAPIEALQYVSAYAEMPELVQYRVDGLVHTPEVCVYTADGTATEVVKEGKSYSAGFVGTDEIPEEYLEDALYMAETWSLFNTRDLEGSQYGLSTVRAFLIKDSDYYVQAKNWATSIDITFTSKHTLDDPPFSNVSVTNFIQYSDICYSCDIYFEKILHLTRTHEDVLDVTDSNYIFLCIDDSDDGTDNPHWCIADMVTNVD